MDGEDAVGTVRRRVDDVKILVRQHLDAAVHGAPRRFEQVLKRGFLRDVQLADGVVDRRLRVAERARRSSGDREQQRQREEERKQSFHGVKVSFHDFGLSKEPGSAGLFVLYVFQPTEV